MAELTPAEQVAAALAVIRDVFADMARYRTVHNRSCGCELFETATETAERILAAMEGRAPRFWWDILNAEPGGERAHVVIDRATIECVLLDHADELDDTHGKVDANLAELAHVYQRLTGFDAKAEAAR